MGGILVKWPEHSRKVIKQPFPYCAFVFYFIESKLLSSSFTAAPFKATTGVRSDVLTQSRQLSIIRVSIHIREYDFNTLVLTVTFN